ncbi:hypothetical protein F2P81_016667 [Scophthalmus maximus]|uniref:Uncharacterized protein n=1 Tax=Scophthalmus maximus TaxID=52904 RepID=A0A6A4SP50_SCOMX|nr:hypothetical protein F2P81_016667 [Scophthalmus maximus]
MATGQTTSSCDRMRKAFSMNVHNRPGTKPGETPSAAGSNRTFAERCSWLKMIRVKKKRRVKHLHQCIPTMQRSVYLIREKFIAKKRLDFSQSAQMIALNKPPLVYLSVSTHKQQLCFSDNPRINSQHD